MRSLPLLLGLSLLGCTTSASLGLKDPATGGVPPTATGGASGDQTAGAGGLETGGAAGAAGSPVDGPSCPPPLDLGVRMVGRHDGCEPDGIRFRWSGSGFVAAFSGTGASVILDDEPNQYTVVLDNEVVDKLVTEGGRNTHVLATGLEAATHRLELYRRTEASFGPSRLIGLEIEDGTLLPPPPAPPRRIEVIGDSISCGYGIEGDTATCSFSADTENHFLTYGAVLARRFDAELSTIAWSGKGVVANWGGNRVFPLPALYPQAVDSRAVWDFTWQPQVVVINLGTNDFSADTDPTVDEFVTAYTSFLSELREVYPDAELLCTVGPMLTGATLTEVQTHIAAAVDARVAAGDDHLHAVELTTTNDSPGCDYHPNPATNAAMATELAPVLTRLLGW